MLVKKEFMRGTAKLCLSKDNSSAFLNELIDEIRGGVIVFKI